MFVVSMILEDFQVIFSLYLILSFVQTTPSESLILFLMYIYTYQFYFEPNLSSFHITYIYYIRYLKYVDRWWDELFPVILPHLYSQGGNILMVQLENEFGSYGDTENNLNDYDYMNHLRLKAIDLLGSDTQLYTTDGGNIDMINHGTLAGLVLATGDGSCDDTCDDFFNAEDSANTDGYRVHTDSEYYTGWLTHWGETMANTSTVGSVSGVATLLASNASVDLCKFNKT